MVFLLLSAFFLLWKGKAQTRCAFKDIYGWANDSVIVFGNRATRLCFNATDGEIVAASDTRSGIRWMCKGETPDVDANIDGVWVVREYGARLTGHSWRKKDASVRLSLTLAVRPANDSSAGYRITVYYDLSPGSEDFRRWATLRSIDPNAGAAAKGTALTNATVAATTNGTAATAGRAAKGDTRRRFNGFRFALHNLFPNDHAACTLDAPGPFYVTSFIPPAFPYDSLKGRDITFHSAPDAGLGILSISHPALTVTAWMNTGGVVNYGSALRAEGPLIGMEQTDLRYRYMGNGQSVISDRQWICTSHAGLRKSLLKYREMLRSTMPLDPVRPAWVDSMVLLELYPAYFADGFRGITARLPFYQDIGFNTLYLMPHWEGGYSPIDLFKVDPHYGTAADLRELVKEAHRLGMRVLFDMVIHGFSAASPLVRQRPDLFIHNRDGSLALHPTWRSVSTDWASPAYRRYMCGLVRHDLDTYDIDGYRVDAASYKGPNWDTAINYPAYGSGDGSPALMRAMLQTLRAHKPEAMLLSEVFGPVFYSVSNLVHDNQTEAAQMLLEKMEKGSYPIARYKEYMDHVYTALPVGAKRVYFTRNHDTSWFYHFKGYTRWFMALEAIHALFGIPEVFAGDPDHGPEPDDDPAVFGYYKQLFRVRRDYPLFRTGEVCLHEINSDNQNVFAGLRREGDRAVIGVISASPAIEIVAVSFTGMDGDWTISLKDVRTGQRSTMRIRKGSFSLRLDPFQVIVANIVLRQK